MEDLSRHSKLLLDEYEELLYLQTIELMKIRILNLFLERKMEITDEIRSEIDTWVLYVNGNAIAKYLRKNPISFEIGEVTLRIPPITSWEETWRDFTSKEEQIKIEIEREYLEGKGLSEKKTFI